MISYSAVVCYLFIKLTINFAYQRSTLFIETINIKSPYSVTCGPVLLQLVEGYQVNSLQLNPNAEDVGYGRQPAHQPQGDGFFHPLECEPTLQIGYALLNI